MNKYVYTLGKSLLLGTMLLGAGKLKAQDMALDWAKNIPNNFTGSPSGFIFLTDYTIDSVGNSYITGVLNGTLDMDPGPGVSNLVANGTYDIFILKLDATGNYVWAKHLGEDGGGSFFASQEANTINVDKQGNVLIAGSFIDTLDMDPGPGVANLVADATPANSYVRNGFILKLDSAGNYVWAVRIGDTLNAAVSQVTTDESGNVFATGKFRGTVDFDPGPGVFNLTTYEDIFLLKLNAAGTFQQASKLNIVNDCEVNRITLDKWGNAYIAGTSTVADPDACSFCSKILAAVWKLDPSGNISWFYRPEGSFFWDEANDITCDISGGVYVSGYFGGTIDFDPGPGFDTLSAGNPDLKDVFILKLDTAGNNIWARALNTNHDINHPSADFPHVALDAANNLVIAGGFYGTTDFDPGPGTANLTAPPTTEPYNVYDIFLLKMDTAGNYKWVKSIGGNGMDYAEGLGCDAHGNLWCTGVFDNTVDFDPGPGVTNLSPSGTFIIKLVCNDTTSSILTDTTCDSYTLNGETYTESGTYTQLLPNAEGCDSTITLHLTISVPEPIITVNEFVLGTTEPYTTYQWYLNGTPEEGATNSTYTVSENGDYTVEVTNSHGCTALSPVYTVTNATGINDINGISSQIKIYPNPAKDAVYIESPVPVNATLSGIDGKVLDKAMHAKKISLSGLAAGIYFLQLSDQKNHLIKVEKLVKQNQ